MLLTFDSTSGESKSAWCTSARAFSARNAGSPVAWPITRKSGVGATSTRCSSRRSWSPASLLGLSWDAAQTIMDRAVERGLERREVTPIRHIGIDEKSFGRGHDYITVLTDIDGSRVLDVAPERTQAAAEAVLQTLTVERLDERPVVFSPCRRSCSPWPRAREPPPQSRFCTHRAAGFCFFPAAAWPSG